jgi:hypothetical protein
MAQKGPKSSWRTLDEVEIALMKRMHHRGLPRDLIMSFFVLPGRLISPAVVFELDEKRPDIQPATDRDVEAYINRRLSEANASKPYHGFSPTSELRVRDVLQATSESQKVFPGFESHYAELKERLPIDKASRARTAKTLAAFANHVGGYIFFGIKDNGDICGVPDGTDIEKVWDELSDITNHHFTPFFGWERSTVEVGGKNIAVAYAHESDEKPIITTSDYGAEIKEGQIYFRYDRSTRLIRPADLIRILHQRDRKAAAGPRDA